MDEIEELVSKWRGMFGWEPFVGETYACIKMVEMMKLLPQSVDTSEISKTEQLIHIWVLPIIYRIIKGGGVIDDVGELYRELFVYINRHMESILEYQGTTTDIETELCHSFSTDYIYKTKDPITPRKYIKKSWMK
jgi:hypothetical protein